METTLAYHVLDLQSEVADVADVDLGEALAKYESRIPVDGDAGSGE